MTFAISNALRWAEETFSRADLGDTRRTRRLVQLGAQLAKNIGLSVVQSSEGNTSAVEGAYRLLRNPHVSAEAIAEAGFQATVAQAKDSPVLLALEDTTTLSFQHRLTGELGDLGGPSDSQSKGYQVHSVLLMDAAQEHIVGLIDQARWCRDSAKRGQRHERLTRVYEEKESYKWERASVGMAARLGSKMGEVISVCDREADIYEYLLYKTGEHQRFVVRSCWDRRVDGLQGHVRASAQGLPVLGRYHVDIPQKGGRPGRRAEIVLRSGQVTLRCPRRATGRLSDLTVNLVVASEVGEGGPERLEWLLLTSEAVTDFTKARQVVRYYELRWRVEDFHKAWKSGAGVERQRMQTAENLERMAVILAFVAIRLLQLRESLDNEERVCTSVLTEMEWKALWLARGSVPLPATPPSMAWAYENMARLGGWNDSKRTGRAGWKAIWQGWFKLQERVEGLRVAMDMMTHQ